MAKEKIFNVPNTITFLRMLFIIPLIYFIINNNNIYAAAVYLVFVAVDGIDGFIANKLKQKTKFGEYFDGGVDTLMQFAILIFVFLAKSLPFFVFGLLLFGGLLKIGRKAYCIKRKIEYKSTFFVTGIFIAHIALLYLLLESSFNMFYLYVLIGYVYLTVVISYFEIIKNIIKWPLRK